MSRRERIRAPQFLADNADRFAGSGAPPVVPRTAATVILMRELPDGFEVFTQRRAATMAFAPNLYAFPGGSVDPRDADGEVGWVGPPPAWWAQRLGLPEADARAVVSAAVREVFEECGVLLAGPDESTVAGDLTGESWEAARQALLAREVALVDLLRSLGLVLRADLLAPWARWLTPEFEARRFDTFFFLARLPADQATRDVGGEAEHTTWLRAVDAAALPMLPPTWHTLTTLTGLTSIDAAMLASRERDVSRPIRPRLEVDQEGPWLVWD